MRENDSERLSDSHKFLIMIFEIKNFDSMKMTITRKHLKFFRPYALSILTAGLLVCSSVLDIDNARAEGYQVNSLSTRQLGMGYAGVALKLGSESVHYNPGALAYMGKKFDFSAGVTAIISQADYKSMDGSYKAKSDNPVSTPFFVYMGYKPFEKLAFGLAVNTPAGNSIKWPDHWRGATLVESIDMRAFNIQPTVSYKIADFLSIGAGVMMDFGGVNLKRALIPAGGLDKLSAYSQYMPQLGIPQVLESVKEKTPLGVTLKGSTKLAWGYNIGALLNVTPNLSIGVSYRSKIRLKLEKGEAELRYANKEVKQLIDAVNSIKPGTISIPPLDKGNFETSLPLPSNLNIGVAYKFRERLTVTGELQFVGWKAYDSLKFQFDEKVLGGYSTIAPKKYKNTIIYRIGAEYAVCDIATVRIGGYYDSTPVRDNLYNPETPGSNKRVYTAGASLMPFNQFSVDLGLGYIHGLRRYGSYPEPATADVGEFFEGKYKCTAWLFSIGIKYSF